jgi:mannose-6-phosphate isomerase-like protein (cupin superfamily)
MSDIFPYQVFIENEGLPIHREVVGVEDVTALERKPWARTGGLGAFIELEGTFQSERGVYVGEIPGRGALEPEKHLYEEQIFILQGRGLTEVWQDGREKVTFEWGEGSIFALPRNAWHKLYNGGSEAVIYLGVTTAPALMNALDDLDLIFNSDYRSPDLYAEGNGRYFAASDLKTTEGWYKQTIWHTNFIPDAFSVAIDPLEQKVRGGLLTGYRMGKRFPHGHISQWPEGRYHKAHYHGPGAILLGLDGEGYVLAWPSELGPRPYQDGHADKVHKVRWRRNSIYSPPNAYFHQHFNTGRGPARHVAVYGMGLPLAAQVNETDDGWRGFLSVRQGGTLIEHEEEDPQIRADFEAELRSKGIECAMPEVAYV